MLAMFLFRKFTHF